MNECTFCGREIKSCRNKIKSFVTGNCHPSLCAVYQQPLALLYVHGVLKWVRAGKISIVSSRNHHNDISERYKLIMKGLRRSNKNLLLFHIQLFMENGIEVELCRRFSYSTPCLLLIGLIYFNIYKIFGMKFQTAGVISELWGWETEEKSIIILILLR